MNIPEFIAFDLETTGLDAEKDEIIEIALVRFIHGNPADTLHALIRPSQELRPFITQLTGIQAEELQQAEPFAQWAPRVRDFIGDVPLVAHNAQFDGRFLRRAMTGHDIPFDLHPILDSLLIARLAWREAPNHRLETLMEYLGFKQESAHRALPDAMACGHLFVRSAQQIAQFSSFTRHHMARLVQGTPWAAFFPDPDQENPPSLRYPMHHQDFHTRPSTSRDAIPQRVKDWFGEQGLLAQHLPTYTPRETQNTYAGIAERNLFRGGIAVLEAGPGTGKTLGYLIPALLKAAHSGERVLISTATKTLQEQLWQKDLPQLMPLFGSALKPALVKGRNNYLCLRKFHEHLEHPELLLTAEEREAFLPLIPWVEVTATGDVSENTGFGYGRNRQLWNKLQSDSSTCVGQACPHFQHCFGLNARRRAAEANVVLVNHSLFLHDLALDFALLPPYDHAIFDEAHRLPELSHAVFGKRVWFFRFRNQMKILAHVRETQKGILGEIESFLSATDHTAAAAIIAQCKAVRELISECEKQIHRLFIKIGKGIKKQSDKANLRYTQSILAEFQADPKPALQSLKDLEEGINCLAKELRACEPRLIGIARDLDGAGTECAEFRKDLEFVALASREDWAFWMEEPGNPHTIVLYAQPLNPGQIWAEKFYPWIKSALFTSATLAVNGELDYYEWRMGLKTRTLPKAKIPFSRILESPWDLDSRRKVIIAGFLPKPNDEKFQESLDETLAAILPELQQNTLALFTSVYSLTQSHQKISPLFAARRKTLLAQHADGTLDNLVELFRKQRGACLMGTQMLWEGVDLPGDALEVLVISKLPFPTPGDALIQAKGDSIRAKGGNSFKDLFIPEAVLAMRQGLGRLIRSESDSGTIILLDNRVLTENYGKSFSRLWNDRHVIAHDINELRRELGIA